MMTKLTSLLLTLSLLGAGCATWTVPLSSHTLSNGAQSEDVVWVLEDAKKIFRCTNSASGPVCTPAKAS